MRETMIGMAVCGSLLAACAAEAFAPANHYSMLAAIERLWGLDCLGESCNTSGSAMLDLFMP
jgi:hypothetical protein